MFKKEYNEFDPKLLGLMAMNFGPGTITGARLQMFGSQISQIVEHDGVTEKQIFTGIEFELGKTTFAIRAPCKMQVIEVFNLYRRSAGYDSIQLNPMKVVLYRNLKTNTLGALRLTEYASHHQSFGYRYRYTAHADRLEKHAVFDEGTVFADAPSVTEEGFYRYGREIPTVYLTTPSSGEDGMTFARSVLEAMTYRTIVKRVVQWGRNKYPVNRYGTPEHFKAFPDIGEYIHPSGILMALREHSPELDLIGQNIYDLTDVDYYDDEKIYVHGPAGRVVDIRVWHDDRAVFNATPIGMEEQAMKYLVAKRSFYADLLKKLKQLERDSHGKLEYDDALHQLTIEALREVEPGPNAIENVDGTDRVDVWRVEFTIEYTHTPDIRSKFTNTAGGKGVVVKVMEDEDMPVDDFGNRAGVIVESASPLNRNNTQQLYEHVFNAYNRDVLHHMRRMLGHDPHQPISGASFVIQRATPEVQDQLIQLLAAHYQPASARMHAQFMELTRAQQLDRIASILSDIIQLCKPPDDQEELKEIAKTWRGMYQASGIEQYSPVTYRTYAGLLERTHTKARIGNVYYMQLEKTGDDWAAVSSGDRQHHGLLATISKLNRHAHPNRNQPTRVWAEAEMRLINANASPRAAAEIADRNNSPMTHRIMVRSILESADPATLPLAIDRTQHAFGSSKPLRLIKHLMHCAGVRFRYTVSTRQQEYRRVQELSGDMLDRPLSIPVNYTDSVHEDPIDE